MKGRVPMKDNSADVKKRIKKTVYRLTVGLVICLGAIFLVFFCLTRQYENNVAYSGASYLTEINRQGETNIETALLKDKNVALGLANDIKSGKASTENELFSSMDFYKNTWNEDNIYVYTEDGQKLDSEGEVQDDENYSAMVKKVLQQGEMFNIVQSRMEYSVAVNTDIRIKGSKIAAVSVVHNLDTIIDNIGLKSFGGKGHAYLTRQDGMVICQSKDSCANSGYSILTLLARGKPVNLDKSKKSIDVVMDSETAGAFMLTRDNAQRQYIALTPVHFTDETLYLFNVVPQATVNGTMNDFVRDISLFALIVILLTIFMFVMFFVIYSKRSRRFEADLRLRERIFDLLVSETNNAFILLYEDPSKPAYVSSNIEEIIKGKEVRIQRLGEGYRLTCGAPGDENDMLSALNEALAKWDGCQEFISGYLPHMIGREERYFRLSLHHVTAEKGGFIGIVQDVTPEYKREKSLREALTLADSANRAKTRFLSSVSHDIRTPLNAIINMTRFLQQDADDRVNAEEELNIIRQSSEHLLRLINDVLDMSRIESGRLPFVNADFNMDDALGEVRSIIRPLCEVKEQQFVYNSSVLHTQLVGDVLRLNQILINVLNNAVKFTPSKGSIAFEATELTPIKSEEIPFRFTVRDTGIGIPKGKIGDIFEPFSRIENKTVHETEGTGLGLAITKRFIDALGGTITVSSDLGRGSVFTIELTYKASNSCRLTKDQKVQSEVPAKHARFDGARALLAEDNTVNVMIATKILSQWGFAVENAKDGQEAFDMFETHTEYYYDIIYMDIQMPNMTGYESTRMIRSCGKADAAQIPVVAMTANAFAEDVERARAAGMNAHVAKPIDIDELNKVTDKLIGRKK